MFGRGPTHHTNTSHQRAALMTGRHPVRTGMQNNVILAGQRLGVPLNYKLLPEYLSDLGYESHMVGKWHLGFFHKNYTPTYRGFKSFYGFYQGHNDYFDHTDREDLTVYDVDIDWWGLDWHYDHQGTLSDVHSDFGQYATRVIANEAGQLIAEYDFNSKPLFLYLPFQSVHIANVADPVQAPQDIEYQLQYIWNNLRRKYVGAVWEMDVAVRNVYKSLQLRGVLNNTIIIFSTDNGGAPNGFQFNWGSNFPLRSAKGYFFEGGTRSVGFVWGEVFKNRKGQVSMDLMHVTDWLPTLYEAAGGDVGKLGDIDGYSMMDFLTGKSKTSPRSEVLINLNPLFNSKAIKVGQYKYLLNPYERWTEDYDGWFNAPGADPDSFEVMFPDTTKSQIWCGDVPTNINLKCHSNITGLDECIYDIERDPCEYYNLVDNPKYQGIKNMLLERIKYWETLQVEPLNPPPYDEAGNPKNFNYVWKPWTSDPTIPPNSFESSIHEL
ncbi:arylsulfatase J-like isoform X2 [Convolutriloba macropyga]|uniref:arylsulfatase J-like isoform X2 n=1 Tax=Convolutriloba macropyga TaxID=536237 RepID=UPI003F527FE7